MNVKLSNELKVGILVTIALAALLWGLNYLKGKDLFSSRNIYYAVYTNVDGLVSSNPIVMNGYRIGIVNNIEFMPDKSGNLLVTLLINDDVFISKNSIAKIFNSDLIGTKAMKIELGNEKMSLNNGDTILAELETGLAQQFGKEVGPIKNKAEDLIVNLDSVVTMLHSLFDPNTKNNLRSGINHLNSGLASFDQLMTSEKGKLYLMISNIESISYNLKANNEQITHILNNLSVVSDSLAQVKFATTIKHADDAVMKMDNMLDKINSGKGSLGKLVNDEELYNSLNNTSKDLDELMKDLKANPNRYVHFSMFGKKDKK
jgi:phospholipid/cholesterol/gamma-HCH transport system substrate-binding protein